jgi:tetratricopeptide (TPR) repeat protein
MKMGRRGAIAAGLLLLGLAALPARAGQEHCGLSQIAELKMQPNDTGSVLVPVGLAGQPSLLMLDTGAFWSVLRKSVVQGMRQRSADNVIVTGAGGGDLDRYVTLPSVQFDQSTLTGADFFVGPDELTEDTRVAGNFGANLMQHFDVEIDPGRGEVNLYRQDHCKGVVVYWEQSDATKLPFDLDSHLITVPVLIDGKPLRALIDTGATTSVLSLKAAKALFGLQPDSPGVKPSAKASTLDGRGLKLYKYRFKTLEIGAIRFSNPELTLGVNHMEDSDHEALGDKAPDLILGMHQLRLLHLYIAYGEKTLYASTVQGDLAAAAQAGGTPAKPYTPPADPLDVEDAQELVTSAEAHAQKGEFDLALQDLDLAERTAPAQPWIYFNRGIVQDERKDYADAIADFGRSLALKPDDPDAYINRAHIYWRANDSEHALQDSNKALELNPALKDAYLLRALVRIRQNDAAGALRDLDQALRLDPGWATALSDRCVVRMRLKQYPAALDDCNAALAADPNDLNSLLNRAALNFNTRKYRAAADDYSAALKLQPDQPHALYGRGLARKASGDRAGEADLAEAQRQDPTVVQDFSRE